MKKIFAIMGATVLLASCNCDFSMLTTIKRNGEITRSFICPADSALVCGEVKTDIDEAVLPIIVTDKWDLSWNSVDGKETHPWPMTPEEYSSRTDSILLKAERHFKSAEEMRDEFQFDIIPLKPSSKFEKKFKWFYTEYTFSETFPQPEFSIPVYDYLTEEEAKYWFTGKGREALSPSGSVHFEILCNIGPKVNKWLGANYLAEICQYISEHYDEVPEPPIDKEAFAAEKCAFVKKAAETATDDFLTDTWLSQVFKDYFGTDVYMKCISDKKDSLPSETWSMFMNFGFAYSVVLPGKPYQSSYACVNGKVQTFNLNLGMIYAGDYTVTAKSRTANIWFWILTVILLVFVEMKLEKFK